MKQKLQMQVTGLSSTYVFFNQKTATWLEFEGCKYPKFKFVKYVSKHFQSYYTKCLDEISVNDNDAICEWFYNYCYENGETYTFTAD